ncbi:MAG: class III poly(R)-hydroxyalkanoic acid synthase subunit PhaC [Euryarchaeota archaeon]|nr:class III poly(R)-hydroxyalkanoic acid synthase subunit PhaC [Euryarchaeota archaeon]
MYKPIFMGDIEKFKRGMEVLLKNPDYSVGMTPSEVIYTENKMKVLHYIPTVEKTHHTPILIVYALVNRYYILDLQPDKSVIKRLLDEGFDVYLIDWGYPSGLDKYLTLDDYVNGYINTAVDKVRERKGVDKITLFGVCQGGTFSVMYAALHPEKVKNLITLVAPFDFDTDEGILFAWSKSLDVDKIVDYYGIVPGDILNIGFLLADPCRTMIDKYIGLFERMECDDDEECELRNEETMKNFLRMEKWIFDSPSQAGEAYRQFLKDCYQKNLLIKNEMMLGGKTINLKNITMPLLNMMGKFDHLVPNEASKPLSDVVSSDDKTTLVISTGHAGMFVGSKSQKEVCPTIVEWLKPKSLPDQTGEEKPKEVEEKPKEVEENPAKENIEQRRKRRV